LTQEARAGLIVNRDSISLLTARTRQDEEALFVLDSRSGKLLIYRLNVANSRQALELAESVDLPQLFNSAGSGSSGPDSTGTGR
jgi:hypothetical protein